MTLGPVARRPETWLLASLACLTVLRLWWCGRVELSPDEAYYWLWSQRLDWAYFSKGPGVALAIRVATGLAGDTERGVRWLSPLLALATTGLLWLLVRDALGRTTATPTAIVLQCVPLFSTGALLMTVDPLSAFWWTLSLLLGWRALRAGPASSWWLATGAAAGLGLLCKYTNALALLGIALAALLRRDRGGASGSGTLLRLGAGFAPFALPPLAWNLRHGWPTASHLLERGGLGRDGPWLQPLETLEFVVTHLVTWSPVIFTMMLLALPSIVRRGRDCDATRYLLFASAPILALYAVLALHEAGEANWTGPGLLGILPLAVHHWLPALATRRGRVVAVSGLALGALLSLALANTDLLRAAGIPLAPRHDPSNRVRGWRETAEAVSEARGRLESREGRRVPLVANHYGVASELAFYGRPEPLAPGHPPVHVPATARPRNQYWFWPGYLDAASPKGASVAMFVTDRAGVPDGLAASCEHLADMPIESPAGTLRTVRAFACRDLRDPNR